MAKFFISYRRIDAKFAAPRLLDALVNRFGSAAVFMDVESIPLGVDFRKHISDLINQCDIFLILIGENWIGGDRLTKTGGIYDPQDFVRIELETAFSRGIPIVPILIDSGEIPKPEDLPESIKQIVFRNWADYKSGSNEKIHLAKIVNRLTELSKDIERKRAIAKIVTKNLEKSSTVKFSVIHKIFAFSLVVFLYFIYNTTEKLRSTQISQNIYINETNHKIEQTNELIRALHYEIYNIASAASSGNQ